MDKRTLTTIAISIGILLFWMTVIQPRVAPRPTPPPTPAASATDATKPADAPKAEATKPADAPKADAPKADAPKAAKAEAPKAADAAAIKPAEPEAPEVVDTLELPGLWRAQFTSYGAAPKEWTLLDPQYQEPTARDAKTLKPINLVRTDPTWLPLMITFISKDFDLATTAHWKRESATATELVYSWDSERVHVEKRISAVPGSYAVQVAITVANKSDKPIEAAMHSYLHGRQDPNAPAPSFFNPVATQTQGFCDVAGKLEGGDWGKLGGKPIGLDGKVRWVDIDEKFFVVALAAGVSDENRHCALTAGANHYISADLSQPAFTVAAGAKQTLHLAGYFGPKLLHQLDEITVGGPDKPTDAKLGSAIDYGYFEIIARPMLAVLKAFHRVIPNWGVAIIVLTLLIYAVTWWPTQTSVKSMRAMSKLKPELDKLKARYGDDRQGFAMAQMKLFKEKGVSPFAGCLPTVIQIPIYIALFAMLRNSVELYRSPFIAGWISDLTAPDPFYAMPLVAGALTIIQQRFSPPPTDPNQRMMMYAMPIMFVVFTIFLPAGLALYTLTRSILSLAQYFLIYRSEKPTPGLSKRT